MPHTYLWWGIHLIVSKTIPVRLMRKFDTGPLHCYPNLPDWPDNIDVCGFSFIPPETSYTPPMEIYSIPQRWTDTNLRRLWFYRSGQSSQTDEYCIQSSSKNWTAGSHFKGLGRSWSRRSGCAGRYSHHWKLPTRLAISTGFMCDSPWGCWYDSRRPRASVDRR